jgi:transposase
MKNMQIRDELKLKGVKQWELADAFGISEFTFTRWLRKEVSEGRRDELLKIIGILADEKNGGKSYERD